MRDQDHPHPALLDDPAEHVHDPRLRRHVERRRRLVRDQHVGVRADRHRDHRRAAACRPRTGADSRRRAAPAAGCPTSPSSSTARVARLAAADALVGEDRLDDLTADGLQRVQRRHRILVDEREPAAAHARHLPLGEASSSSRPREEHLARRDPHARRQQPHQRRAPSATCRCPTRRRSRPGGPAATVERDAAHRPDRLAPRRTSISTTRSRTSRTTSVGRSRVERRRHEREGSRTFCRLSPSTFSASTATRITSPGKSG